MVAVGEEVLAMAASEAVQVGTGMLFFPQTLRSGKTLRGIGRCRTQSPRSVPQSDCSHAARTANSSCVALAPTARRAPHHDSGRVKYDGCPPGDSCYNPKEHGEVLKEAAM